MKRLRIFIASPGDVPEERDVVALVVEELRRIIGAIRDVELEAVRWETHAWPDVGDDAQAVINREIGEYDVFVGVMWRRFGTPTKRADSGTGEEFENAYETFKQFGRPRIMFYFRTTPFYSTNGNELSQFRKVVRFRKKLENAGVLFWQYDKPIEFERFVREHLIRQLLDPAITVRPAAKAPKPKRSGRSVPAPQPMTVFMSAAREDSPRVIALYRALGELGFRPWLDVQDLVPGQQWEASLKKAISSADIFLVFLSAASISKRGYVHRELALVLSETQRRDVPVIIPVRLDPVDPPPALAPFQWVDLFEPDGVENLVTAIRRVRDRVLGQPESKREHKRRGLTRG